MNEDKLSFIALLTLYTCKCLKSEYVCSSYMYHHAIFVNKLRYTIQYIAAIYDGKNRETRISGTIYQI